MKKENLNNVLNKKLDSFAFDIHTVLPAKVLLYYGHNERKAKVQPLINFRDDDNNIYLVEPIDNVPVIFPSTKTFSMTYPLNVGDGCLLLFSEVNMGNYLNSKMTVNVDADDSNKFELKDCICIPGLWSFKNTPTPPVNNDDFFLEYENAKIQIEKTTNTIIIQTTLGKIEIDSTGNITFDDGTESYVLGDTLDTWFTSILLSIFNSHTHSSPAGGNTGSPNTALTPPINYLSNFIKGK